MKQEIDSSLKAKKKLILAGSPWFAAKIFEKIINNYEVLAIISQPDKKKDRNLELKPTSVSLLAEKYNIKLFKPENINSIIEEITNLDYDYFLTFGYGQKIPNPILEHRLSLNIHCSILPKYRGANPIYHAVLNQDQEIGVCLIEMVEKMDAGDIYYLEKTKLNPNFTTSQALEVLINLVEKNIIFWINNLSNVKPIKQDENLKTLAPKLKKDSCKLSFDMDFNKAYRLIKACSENPCAFVYINNKRIKIFNVSKQKIKNALKLSFKNGDLYSFDYQFESKKRVKIDYDQNRDY